MDAAQDPEDPALATLVGDLSLDCDMWDNPDGGGQRLMVRTNEPGSASHDRLRILTSWTATPCAHGLENRHRRDAGLSGRRLQLGPSRLAERPVSSGGVRGGSIFAFRGWVGVDHVLGFGLSGFLGARAAGEATALLR